MGRGVENEARQEDSEQCSSRRGGGSQLRVQGGAAEWRLRPRRVLFCFVALAAVALLAGRAGAVRSEKLQGLQTPASHLRAKKIMGEGYGHQVRWVTSVGPLELGSVHIAWASSVRWDYPPGK